MNSNSDSNDLSPNTRISEDINILHVEDDDDTRNLIKTMLEMQNEMFSIISAKNPEVGMDILDNNSDIDCIISDYKMPKMNGIEFLKYIRKEYNRLPFILFTGTGSEDIAHTAINNGANDYMQKDFCQNKYELMENRIINFVSEYRTRNKLIERSKELEDERNFITQAIDGIQDIFYVLETDGTVIRVNKYGEEFVKKMIDEDSKDNTNIINIFPESQKSQIEKSISTLRGGNDVKMNLKFKDNKDNRIEIEVKSSPLKDSFGEIIGIVGVARDVTKQNEYKRKLKRKNKKLDEFAKIISHDIRNPLSIAKGHLDLYINENETDSSLEKTHNAINRIENILDEVLEITTTDSATLEKKHVNIQYIVNNCWENIDTKDADIHIGTNTIIPLNEKLASRLFENIFKNSIKHGGKDVKIKIGAIDSGFYIEDDGKGIPSENRNKIFNSAYTTSSSGKGLGLTIVEHVCDAHEWDINVKESESGGARFEITNVK